MFYHARNLTVKIENTDMDYICFGTGQKNLIMIPGLGDGLKTVKGTAAVFACMYKQYAKDYKVYVFSRKNAIEAGYSTKDMAEDQVKAMKELGLQKVHVMGISQGGMIAQYMAILYPELIDKLILAVTVSKSNHTVRSTVGKWIALAEKNDYKGIMIDTAEKSYSERKLKKYRFAYPLLTMFGKPKSLKRFIIQANACIEHDAYEELAEIKMPTLVIGGDSDKVVGERACEDIAERIEGSKLIVYKGLGHMAYEEAKDFNQNILRFLKLEEVEERG